MTRASAPLLCAILLAGCASSDSPTGPGPAVSAAAATVVHVKDRYEVVVDDVILNECSGEMMEFHFDQLVVAHDLEIVGKAFHARFHQVDRGSWGTGLETGATYRQVGKAGGTFLTAVNIDEVQTYTASVSVIGTGGVPSGRSHITYHITVGPSGDLVVEFEKARFTCR